MTDRDDAKWGASRGAPNWAPANVDLKTDVPHSARVYDYILGGKDNFPADRAAGDQTEKMMPGLSRSMRANRNFMARMAHVVATEHGIRQFLDIGTGLPTTPNLHEVVQKAAPESRIVYVDNDPIVLVHARALLTSTPEGRTAYLDADFTDPESILKSEQLASTLDLSQPVALSLIALVQFIPDEALIQHVIDTLVASLAPGSILALSTATGDYAPEAVERGVAAYRGNGIPMTARDKATVEGFFRGLEILDPGVVLVHRWHPDADAAGYSDNEVFMYGAIARKL
ncbi:O-Methyltransferase involved in polyketide biosynthesis [Parafrankia irregularis]|uniref:O-Methyltransferase involved in polyketide biosynthesis n=1 Tax=Parafrankia irregularis TaxID=795642 RepID=A0A0S4QJ26_9ACTN|nr:MULTISPECIES: SAM-dependent methyltransferase [Parafrankia]MBE3203815.1 SAM-dependent methyltransferase [Parafrankia sp. CH37]CUU55316.1 O-Methyltransferase involved in polyketide biosynthesis [Parafrankia irregularis]